MAIGTDQSALARRAIELREKSAQRESFGGSLGGVIGMAAAGLIPGMQPLAPLAGVAGRAIGQGIARKTDDSQDEIDRIVEQMMAARGGMP